MQTPTLIARTDPARHLATVEVVGSLSGTQYVDQMMTACASSPASYGLLVVLSSVTSLNEVALDGLRAVARMCANRGQTLAFVCTELLLRAELVLADLDTLAPVVESDEQAQLIVSLAA
jgi:anti-anti-sigma regulatory factor